MNNVSDTQVSRAAFIGSGVELGHNVTVGPGAVLLGPCKIEDNVWIGPSAQIGAPPEMTDQQQNAAWTNEFAHAGVLIERDSVIREGAVIHQGTYRTTRVGAGSWILNRAYLAHDVQLGREVTISAGVSIGGHCVIGNGANLGMNAAIHQRRFVGAGTMVAMNTPVTSDLPPFVKAYGSPVRVHGLNLRALEFLGLDTETQDAYFAALLEGAPLPASLVSQAIPSLFADALRAWDNLEHRKDPRFV